MMARAPNDPTSWTYQAAMHGTVVMPAMPLWNGCEHGALHFLSWHRWFLYFLERIQIEILAVYVVCVCLIFINRLALQYMANNAPLMC